MEAAPLLRRGSRGLLIREAPVRQAVSRVNGSTTAVAVGATGAQEEPLTQRVLGIEAILQRVAPDA